MGSLSGIFNTSRNALAADQAAINVTAANIANQNTDGYSKRTVSFAENDTVFIAGAGVGTGASATVTAQRDRVLDRTLQQATDTASSSSARLTALKQLEDVFSISSSGSDNSGIADALSAFASGISAVAADPTSTSARQTAFAAAQTLAGAFNRTAAQLATQTSSLNSQAGATVAQANTLLSAIAGKNAAITSSLPGADASSLEDQRTQLITQLSQLIGLQQTTTENGGITLSTTNGTLLVDGASTFPLTTANVAGTTRVLAASSLGGTDITSSLQGGSLAGSIRVRDTDLPAISTQLDTLAHVMATVLNTQNQAGLDASGNAGQGIFYVPATTTGTAATLSVVLASGAGFAAASTAEGTSGNSNANAMLALQSSPLANGQTFSGAYSSLLAGIGTTVSSATTDSTADTAIQTQLATQRDSVSGVSLDEEASNLTQYQRSYQAAAKLLAVLNELLATAINLGTDTPVSS